MKKFIWVGLAVICATVAIWSSLDLFLTDSYAASFEPKYVDPTAFDPDASLLLKPDLDADALLITARGRSEAFKFDSATNQVTRIESSQWTSSGAPEIDCNEQIALDEYSGDHYGSYLLGAKRSHDKQFIAILSAYGPKGPAVQVLPNLGGPGLIMGTRYLEIRRSSDNARLGRPIRINIPSDAIQPSLCWTPSSRYLVIHDQANSISIVDLKNR